MSYSAHTPHEAHVMCINKPAGPYMRPTLDCTCEKVSLPVHISPTHCPHMLDVLHATVGMDGLIYLFAKVSRVLPQHRWRITFTAIYFGFH